MGPEALTVEVRVPTSKWDMQAAPIVIWFTRLEKIVNREAEVAPANKTREPEVQADDAPNAEVAY